MAKKIIGEIFMRKMHKSWIISNKQTNKQVKNKV